MSDLKKNFSIPNILMTFLIVYLPIFSFGIFAPTEIYFANYVDLKVIFEEFGWKFLGYGTLGAVIVTLILLLLPKLLQKILLTVLWIFSLCGYIQTMFLNNHIDLIGETTDGYIPETSVIVKNFFIWAAVIVTALFIVIKNKDDWKKPVFLTSLILLATQGVAYGTLFLTAPPETMEYAKSEYYLSGEKQYTVSSQDNVIVFVLDTVANLHYDSLLTDYPETIDYLSDFTYYNNTDCNYWGTFPSLVHLLTGYEFDTTLPINDWVYDCWNNDATVQYYNALHEAGYQVNVFAIEPWLFTISHSLSLVEGRIDNLTTQESDRYVDHETLYQTLLEMSCYRFMPDYFKPLFDVPNTQYNALVTYPGNKINYTNPDFYSDLVEKGLTVNDEEKYVTFYHLNGIHELINDENCQRVQDSGSVTATMKGIWVMLDEYLQQLRACGVYDNSTIIITSDHGAQAYPQSIFFIKEANERHDTMKITNAPITLDELHGTIAFLTTGENDYIGDTIYDYQENQMRERTIYIRDTDTNYPSIKRYDGADTNCNVFKLYTYTGNYDDFWAAYCNYDYEVVVPYDSYF